MRSSTKLIIRVHLSENFLDDVYDTMEEEFIVACKKWKVKLNTEKHDFIFEQALKQLSKKMSEVCKTNWDLQPVIDVKISNINSDGIIELPYTKNEPLDNLMLLKTRSNGWKVDDEDNEKSVPIKDFDVALEEYIKDKASIAVFYGVGSYV